MSFNANRLITEAYYVGDIVARGYQQPTEAQVNNGLISLNRLFASTAYETGTIPYFTNYQFDAVIGQEVYFIPNLITARILTFTLSNVRFALSYQGRDAYFGSFRAENVNSLMFTNHIEKTKGGANLYMYFKPDQTYPCQLWGLFKLPPVTQFQDLSLTIDDEYINYLLYALARKLCLDSGREIPRSVQEEYERIYDTLNNNASTPDVNCKKLSTFGNMGSPNYANANFGNAWQPPSTY